MRRPCNKKDAPTKQRGIRRTNIYNATRKMRPHSSVGLGENIYKLKNADKAAFYTPFEARVLLAPTSKSPEEREFAVDSGASSYEQKDLSSDELDTLRRSWNPTVVLTAIGKVHTNEAPVRDNAITRRSACCSIAWQTLRRPRIVP